MATKRHKPEESVTVRRTRQVEVLVGQGMARIDAIREIGITEQTYFSPAPETIILMDQRPVMH
ncbi:MAG: hypothetical protein GY789_25595 [Hyphomicrobiales bacterium]|nr:hypothetical protein [Hyphomicrobiales bacterium]MCP5002007.1 hypothetical protein [Hyphomicrobiales bacterium]